MAGRSEGHLQEDSSQGSFGMTLGYPWSTGHTLPNYRVYNDELESS